MKDRISQDLKTAMKSRDTDRLSTLRMILSEVQYKEKEKGIAVDDQAVVQILQSMVRKRREAAEQFEKGGRRDLSEKELAEITVIESYLPEQLAEELADRPRFADLMARYPFAMDIHVPCRDAHRQQHLGQDDVGIEAHLIAPASVVLVDDEFSVRIPPKFHPLLHFPRADLAAGQRDEIRPAQKPLDRIPIVLSPGNDLLQVTRLS